MNNHSRTGKCLCGKVAVSMARASNKVEACHCSMCRTWGGGPLLSFEGCKELNLTGEEWVGIYQSSEWAQRAFCKSCGSHLYYKLTDTGDFMVPPGLMTEDEELELELEVFVDEKPGFYDFAQATEKLTGKEVIERFQNLLSQE